MARRYIHHLDHSGLHCFAAAGSKLELLARFDSNESGVGDFAVWLANNPRGLHTLVVDLPEEGFQYETVPHVSWGDRNALLGRKLGQFFAGSPYATAISLGRERSGRRDERVLFVALTRPLLIEPWMRALRQREAAISALYSVPLLTQRLLAALPIDEQVTRGLIVTFSRSGMRQTFFDGKQLRFSRLCPAPEGPFHTWGPACLRETHKTWQYLNAQRWTLRDEMLPVWVLLERADFEPILAALDTPEPIVFHPVDLNALTQHHAGTPPAEGSDSRPLMLQLALRQARGPQLAPPAERQVYRLWQVRGAITAVGILGGASLAMWALKYFVEANALAHQTVRLYHQRESIDRRYQELLSTLPGIPTSLDDLQRVVARLDRIAADQTNPGSVLLPLSHALDKFPDIELRRIDWQKEDPPVRPGASPGGAETGRPGATRYIALVEATLPLSAASEPRAAMTRIREFAADLRNRAPGSEMVLPRMPFDAAPDKTLRSEAGEGGKAPEFQLRWTTTTATVQQ